MSYKDTFEDNNKFVMYANNPDMVCELGIFYVPFEIDTESYAITKLGVTVGELLEKVQNNICIIQFNTMDSNGKYLYYNEIVKVCYYDNENSCWTIITENTTLTASTLDDFPTQGGGVI